MRIAQVAPLTESVPPKLYGGIERIVSYLCEEFVSLGHEVTLFASGDSVTNATLEPCCTQSLRLDPACPDPIAFHIAMIERITRALVNFDVVHSHIDWLPLPLFRRLNVPYITTMHGRLESPECRLFVDMFRDAPFVARAILIAASGRFSALYCQLAEMRSQTRAIPAGLSAAGTAP